MTHRSYFLETTQTGHLTSHNAFLLHDPPVCCMQLCKNRATDRLSQTTVLLWQTEVLQTKINPLPTSHEHERVYIFYVYIYGTHTYSICMYACVYITLCHYERSEMKIKQLDLLGENNKLMDLLKKARKASCDDLELIEDYLYAGLYAF